MLEMNSCVTIVDSAIRKAPMCIALLNDQPSQRGKRPDELFKLFTLRLLIVMLFATEKCPNTTSNTAEPKLTSQDENKPTTQF